MFEYDHLASIDGIFSAIMRTAGGNPHDMSVVEITSSSDNGKPQSLLDYAGSGHWNTQSIPDSWIQFDFENTHVWLSSYTIKIRTQVLDMRISKSGKLKHQMTVRSGFRSI